MSGVNPFNFASWNLSGLTWNAWGEPNEVGLDDAPPVTTTPPPPPPPPAQATDTVTIGSNFTFDLGSYQPPNGWSQTDIPDLYDLYGGVPPPDLAIPELDSSYLLNWNFWLTTEDIFPAARTGVLSEEQALAVDYDAWNNSVAKQIGIDWPKYQQAVEAARYEMQNTPSQAEQSGGSYSFSLSPSDRVSNWSNHPGVLPTITSSEAERINRIFDQYPARFQTKEDLISALASGGFNTIVVRGKNLGENAEGRDLNLGELKRLWVDMRMANYRTAQAEAGGVQNITNNGRPAPSAATGGPYFSNIGPERSAFVLTEDDWKPVGFIQTGTIKLEFTPDKDAFALEGETITGPQYLVPGKNGRLRGYGGNTATLPFFGRSEVFVHINVYDASGKSIYETRVEGSTMFGATPRPRVVQVPPGYTTVRVSNPEPALAKQTTVRVSWPK